MLSGGELAAMVLLDSLARLQPGVLNDGPAFSKTFNPALDGLLDCPHDHTRPEVWNGQDVPPELLSVTTHANIELAP